MFYYILPVLLGSVLLIIPKFFETQLVYSDSEDNTAEYFLDENQTNETSKENEIFYEMTSLRNNPHYIR